MRIAGGVPRSKLCCMPLPLVNRWRLRLADLLWGRELTISVLTNAAWQSTDSLIRLLVGLFIGVWTARHLGAEDYGRLNYALALVGMVAGLPALGIQQIVLRDLVKEPSRTPQILGTVFALKSAAATVAFALVVVMAAAQWHRDSLCTWMAIVIGARILLIPLNMAEIWSYAQLKSRYSAMARNVSFLATSAVRLGLLAAAASVFEFALAATFEAVLRAGLLLCVRRRMGCPAFSEWRYDGGRLRQVLRSAWPMTLAMLVGSLSAQADQVLLRIFCGNQQLGVFVAARQIPMLIAGALGAISSAALPALIETHATNRRVFNARLRLGVQGAWVLGLAVATGLAFLPDALVVAVFGPGYQESTRVLHGCAVSFPLTIVIIACQPYYIVHDLRLFLLTRTVANFLLWLALAVPLIQRYSYFGAILATLGGQLFGIVLDLTTGETREIGKIKLKAMAGLYLLPSWRHEADGAPGDAPRKGQTGT